MIVTYQGLESFKISQGDLSIAVNPTNSRSNSDITLISSSVFAGEGKGFVVSGPGEYEVKDVVVKGFLSKSNHGGEGKVNTIYMITFEGMNLCFLGALSDAALPTETLENLEDIDILFAPIGGEGVLDAAAAYKLAVSLEPSIIIPMHYGDVGEKDALKKFMKEGGAEATQAIEKLVVKKKDLEGRESEIVVLDVDSK